MDHSPPHSSPAGPTLLRPTDRARHHLRRLQIALGLLAVVVAVPVGTVAAASSPRAPDRSAGTAQAELMQASATSDMSMISSAAPVPARWRTPRGTTRTGLVWVDVGLERGAVVTVALDADGAVISTARPPESPVVAGLVAGSAMLMCLWAVVGGVGAACRSRLDARDQQRWTDEWARVEPVWSGRA